MIDQSLALDLVILIPHVENNYSHTRRFARTNKTLIRPAGIPFVIGHNDSRLETIRIEKEKARYCTAAYPSSKALRLTRSLTPEKISSMGCR